MKESNKKISQFLFYFLFNNIDIILFFILVFTKLYMYSKSISPGYLDRSVIIPIIASILVFLGISLILKEKTRISFLYIANIVISAMLIADVMYYRYFKDIITVSSVKNAKMLGDVSSSVASLFNFKDVFYILDVFVLIPFERMYKRLKQNSLKISNRIPGFLILIALGVVVNAGTLYNVSKTQPTLLTAMSNRIYLTKMIGNIDFHAVDAFNFVSTNIKNSKKLPEERVEKIKDFLKQNDQQSGQTKFQGKYSGKNLIVIQVEALQQFVINQKVNGKEITPNLNRWIKKSMYFDNYYYQVAGGTTADAEFMSNNSLYPAQSGAAYYTYSGNTYNSLGVALKNKGYYTAAMHGNTEGFWNRNVMYKAEGFDDFFGQHSYNVDEIIGLGLSDKSFLNQSIEKMEKFKQPYYQFVVTLTSHFPYDAGSSKYGNFDVGKYKGTFMGNYLQAIHYTDEQLGNYLDTLEKNGTLANSVVAIYGDHFAIPKDKMDQLYNFENVDNQNDYTWFKYQKVPLIMHFPDGMNSGVIDHSYTAQMDLYPTLANLMGISKQYMFGKDMLNDKSGKVIFRNGSFIDGKNLYVSWANSYYDLATGKPVQETAKLKEEKDEYTEELQYSDDLLNHNLLKTFLNKE
ncbi:sulfatase-like hydrolase/transferase [Clostridium tyrobutyricum]|uniref:Lipoteichoic acid synthase LtaS Type IVa n=1 Tax=Clostridium tyrobutyricum DIVETGP TaxID=1408889 RepID=W6N7E8_CLOTY|nr:LTA synthase family protein [Clostridium tyrobutyricum]AND84589.1 phosphatase-like protein [Clostridium tyrobutyricum]ANP69195.1 alkaline phosphatase [Clostridium tyrobutyricum]MBV4415574.1 LTA synthase family protein [Clostridium tyrobutyricum]MBV4421345.1 LTA synthase family protein [Clostridium tyrobutyricum]MBV4425047.1 LTA synthase family protein [Clostridium tyrobutyricum]